MLEGINIKFIPNKYIVKYYKIRLINLIDNYFYMNDINKKYLLRGYRTYYINDKSKRINKYEILKEHHNFEDVIKHYNEVKNIDCFLYKKEGKNYFVEFLQNK